MYAMICTRSDIDHTVSIVSRYMTNLGQQHWETIKWILRYLKGTIDISLVFRISDVAGVLEGLIDSDNTDDLERRRSTSGYILLLCGGTISWKVTLQDIITLFTTEAECIAVVEVAKEAIWLMSLIKELRISQESVKLYCDSQSAIYLANDSIYHAKTKHIDVRYHKLREFIGRGDIKLLKEDWVLCRVSFKSRTKAPKQMPAMTAADNHFYNYGSSSSSIPPLTHTYINFDRAHGEHDASLSHPLVMPAAAAAHQPALPPPSEGHLSWRPTYQAAAPGCYQAAAAGSSQTARTATRQAAGPNRQTVEQIDCCDYNIDCMVSIGFHGGGVPPLSFEGAPT
ncbi:hypothetical protein KSP39_PZI016801 [Platanthera zijinensis]|uniref:Retrovirus-related Pol polyprotein from transposon TNT 1-94 n=1 Tax=Platanthera zijinensis TaxID=2320716 RepID=A0AAP0B6M6_9ASPA